MVLGLEELGLKMMVVGVDVVWEWACKKSVFKVVGLGVWCGSVLWWGCGCGVGVRMVGVKKCILGVGEVGSVVWM